MVYLVLTILIAFNALYVAAEFAAVSVRRSKVQQEVESGNRLAKVLMPTLEDGHALDRYVATCQIGITISSLVLGAYGQSRLSPLLTPLFEELGGMQTVAAESTSALIVLIVLTAFQMILGELVPKSLALQYPTKVALYTVLPMRWSERLLAWFIKILNGSGHLILRAMGMEHTGHVHIHNAREIEYLIAESREGGLLDAEEHARLRKALRLGVTSVDEVMVPRTEVVAIPEEYSPDEAMQFAREKPYSRMPVYRGDLDHVTGYMHIQDLARRVLGSTSELPVYPIFVIPRSTSLEQALQMLRNERQHVALVVDEYGGTVGLLTIGDILEDMFGEMADEFKPAPPQPQRLPDGRIRLWGSMRASRAEEVLGVPIDGESVTIGGIIMERLERIPRAGDEVELGDVSIVVEGMNKRRVQTLVATLPQPPDADDEVEGDDG